MATIKRPAKRRLAILSKIDPQKNSTILVLKVPVVKFIELFFLVGTIDISLLRTFGWRGGEEDGVQLTTVFGV